MNTKKRVIILCTGNSCRSQMAEAFWGERGGKDWEVVSAGTNPSGQVDPRAIQVMAEKGIDISRHESKSLAPFLNQHFDWAITVCDNAERECPAFPGARQHRHHSFDDPPRFEGSESERMQAYRRVRDEIEAKVREWIAAG